MTERLEIVFLGTGSPLPSADRCGAGNVVVAGDTNVLVDCGWGAARRLVPAGVRPASIGVALFTHMHTDHMTDVPDFLFQRWTGGATVPLRVFGPEGTQEMIDGFLLALRRDIGYRQAHHGDKLHPDGIRVEVTEVPATLEPHQFLRMGGLSFESFEVDHFPVVPAFGYRVRFGGRSAVLSGDTAFCETLAAAAEGADMLVCEALNAGMVNQLIGMLRFAGREREAALMEDVPSYHIATGEIAALAARAGVGEVVLSHLIPPIPNDAEREAEFMAGMDATYRGRVRVARDMQRIEVTRRRA
ncbi:MAG: MBL fold metallo-hydrolase [Dehalococcoidia bacterium]|nr:MAG: MBL fold metallo-hydrolase [bacterium]MCE7929189.1 MBL fold metallo-hydrolase [Chloroflexi bacterium CFX7]MCK6565956.1 MBL fold metallo-hydrolase [Dehalococcoidia bacterium]MCL4231233.1 MBL fold metallo-hydrolase [Dehalococcoidia bacterium]NUQ55998.1 MBL fold metallo-hydrolase [Dehalococcoidia bacterium]